MAGGLMQLVAYGAQDVYLTGNPQITFFKAVYRRHTNFSIEVIETAFIGNVAFGETSTAVFSRDADLLTRMYVKVTVSSVDPAGAYCAWVRKLGHALITQVEFEIGGTKIDRQYGIWLDIWYELARQGDHEEGYARMIGDIPELTAFNTLVKPEYTLYIPLQFWFNRNLGSSVPMIALQHHDARIHVTFAPVAGLFVRENIFDDTAVTLVSASILTNYVYLDSDERRKFAQVAHEYLIEQVQFNGPQLVLTLDNRYKLDYNHPTKEIIWAMRNGNYTTGAQFVFYTDRISWTKKDPVTGESAIMQAATKIISESVSIGVDPTGDVGGVWNQVLGLTHKSVGLLNVLNNGSTTVWVNNTSLAVGVYGLTDKITADVVVGVDGSVSVRSVTTTLTVRDLSIPVALMTDTRAFNHDPLVYQWHNYGVLIDGSINPVVEAVLHMDGHPRFDMREGAFFNYLQPYQHHSNTPVDGINVYSFALHPENHQPSGTANLSRINETLLIMTLAEPTAAVGLPVLPFLNAANQMYIFGFNYNILRFFAGLAGLAYTTV